LLLVLFIFCSFASKRLAGDDPNYQRPAKIPFQIKRVAHLADDQVEMPDAVARGDTDYVRQRIQRPISGKIRKQCLEYAVEHSPLDMVKLFVPQGDLQSIASALTISVRTKRADLVEYLFREHPLSLKLAMSRFFYDACSRSSAKVVQVFLSHGLDPNMDNGKPLKLASRCGNLEVLGFLLQFDTVSARNVLDPVTPVLEFWNTFGDAVTASKEGDLESIRHLPLNTYPADVFDLLVFNAITRRRVDILKLIFHRQGLSELLNQVYAKFQLLQASTGGLCQDVLFAIGGIFFASILSDYVSALVPLQAESPQAEPPQAE